MPRFDPGCDAVRTHAFPEYTYPSSQAVETQDVGVAAGYGANPVVQSKSQGLEVLHVVGTIELSG